MPSVQPSAMPTNKLIGGAISGPAITAAWSEVATAYDWTAFSGAGFSALVGAVGAMLIGYFIPDMPNIPTEGEK